MASKSKPQGRISQPQGDLVHHLVKNEQCDPDQSCVFYEEESSNFLKLRSTNKKVNKENATGKASENRAKNYV